MNGDGPSPFDSLDASGGIPPLGVTAPPTAPDASAASLAQSPYGHGAHHIFQKILGGIFPEAQARALQLHQLAADIRFKQEAQQHQREVFKMELEDRDRRRKLENFQTGMALHAAGWIPESVGNAMKKPLEDEFGPFTSEKAPVDTGAGKYYAPSQADTDRIAEQTAERTGRAKGIEKKAQEEAYDPREDVDLTAIGGPSSVSLPGSKAVDTWMKIFDRKHPNLHITQTQDDAGNVSIIGTDPKGGGEPKILKTFPRAGKSARDTQASKTAGISSQAQSAMEKAQDEIDKWVEGPKRSIIDEQMFPEESTTMHSQQASRMKEVARNKVLAAVSAHPDELEGGVDKDGNPWIKAKDPSARGKDKTGKKGGASAKPADVIKAEVAKGRPMPAKNVHAAADRLGITDEEFSKLWHDAGGHIK